MAEDSPNVLSYATPRPADPWPYTPALANTVGQLLVWTIGIGVGEAFLGLPVHEDGVRMDVMIAIMFGFPAAIYGLVVFAVVVGYGSRPGGTRIALITGSLNGAVLTALLSACNVVSDERSWHIAWTGLAFLLIGPIVGVVVCRARRTHRPG